MVTVFGIVGCLLMAGSIVVLAVQQRSRRQAAEQLWRRDLRRLAEDDGAEPAEHSPLLVEIYGAQMHARFGDDITSGAPKEWVP